MSNDDCNQTPGSPQCDNGFCRDPATQQAADAAACAQNQVPGNEVLFIGDAFIAASHQITAYVEDFARQAGSLDVGERYRDNSSVTPSALAYGSPTIAEQYARGQTEGTVKVVIMDGGAVDVGMGDCATPPTSDCPALVSAALGARELLSQMAQDGVEHVVYFFYPDPVDLLLRAKMDVLRILIQDVCSGSVVPCVWLDLRPVFTGSYANYIQPDGMYPTAAGSEATARALWAVMQQKCIAQ